MNQNYTLSVSEIFSSLCRHLSANSEVSQVSNDFMRMDTNQQRVEFVHNLLERFGLLSNYNRAGKSNDKCDLYRNNGKEMYNDGRYSYALEVFTRSCAYGIKNSSNLAQSYLERAKTLFKKELYAECVSDIDRALECDYPKNIYDALMKLKEQAEALLSKQDKCSIHEDLPQLSHKPNPLIECAGDCVTLQNSSEMGRYAIASKDIQIGDVIAIEKPYAWIVLPESSLNHCHHCLKVSYGLFPCEHCTHALFCSAECKSTAWRTYHIYECPVMEIMSSLQVSKLTLAALRVAILARDEYPRISTIEQTTHYHSQRYDEIHNLCTNTTLRTNADLFDRALTSALIYEQVKRHTTFFNDLESDAHATFKELILRHVQTAPSNFHEISELVRLEDGTAEAQEIGAGAYSFLSMLNHSCNPNVVRHCYGNAIVLRALAPIKKGEQLFDNYGYHYAMMEKPQRLKHLKSQYFFDCNCEACNDNWCLYTSLPMKIEFEIPQSDIRDLQEGNVEAAHAILKKLLIKAAIFDKLKPCRNLADVQECIKQCYSILSNKRFY